MNGKLHTGERFILHSEALKLFKAQVPPEDPDAYRTVTVEIMTEGRSFRKIKFDDAFVVDYNERYANDRGIGEFSMTLRLKADKTNNIQIDGGHLMVG